MKRILIATIALCSNPAIGNPDRIDEFERLVRDGSPPVSACTAHGGSVAELPALRTALRQGKHADGRVYHKGYIFIRYLLLPGASVHSAAPPEYNWLYCRFSA